MENKFTPGPWKVKDNMIGEENNPNSIALAYKRDYSTFLDGTYKEDVEMLANAKLISQSPRLLSALQKVIEWEAFGNHVDEALMKEIKEAVNLAIL